MTDRERTVFDGLGNSMDSRHLGPLKLVGGVGGAVMETTTEVGDRSISVRIEIDHPTRLDKTVVAGIDFALDGFSRTDELSRQVIGDALRRPNSAPSELLKKWGSLAGQDDPDQDEFLRLLEPVQTTIMPDGGRENLERVTMTYVLADSSAPGRIIVRFRQGTWPEVDPRLQ
ncbi:hypothetical protein [Microbacterium sp.]|uniref:hypothetical protein n=1 Tax=Microbacterium sp. TaxID=51671 RepID=UPI003F9A7CF8